MKIKENKMRWSFVLSLRPLEAHTASKQHQCLQHRAVILMCIIQDVLYSDVVWMSEWVVGWMPGWIHGWTGERWMSVMFYLNTAGWWVVRWTSGWGNEGLSLHVGASHQRDLPAEKEVIASWILAGGWLGKGQQTVFRLCMYSHSISAISNCLHVK